MIGNVGLGTLLITFLLALYSIGASVYGVKRNAPQWIDSARNAMLLTWPLLTLTALSVIALLVTGQYQYEYVANVTSQSMPLYLKVTALWGGQAGSLLFWSWLMAAFTTAVTLRDWSRDREFLPWVIVVGMITLAFFLGLVIFVENPFVRLWRTPAGAQTAALFMPSGATAFVPSDGRGLNPLLRHPGMIIHPPMLYLGFVSYVIPYAFGIAALVTGRTDDRWIRLTRRWSLVAWLFLSLGLLLGSRWAYDVLGWGGYWGWDPVEIAAFMPWLTGTPFLHSVMIQEKRGMLKQWNMLLIILTYALVIFGTFLTRSGVLSSVHAFAQSAIGPIFMSYISITFVVSLALLLRRWSDLKSENQLHSLLSREALFLLNNLVFMAILVVSFWGVIFPLISELVTGQKVTVGPPYYERATGPLFGALLLLMGVAPLSAWGYSSLKTLGRTLWKPALAALVVLILSAAVGYRQPGALVAFGLTGFAGAVTIYEFWRGASARSRRSGRILPLELFHLVARNRRRYGGYVIHLGVVLMAVGVIGIEFFQTETQGTVPQGGELALGSYTISYESLAEFDTRDGRNVARSVVSVYNGGSYVGELYPRRDYFYSTQQPMTIPGVFSTWGGDLYILLVDWRPISAEAATFKVYHNPFIRWLWLGGWVFILGTLVAAWPEREFQRASVRVRREVPSKLASSEPA